MMRGIVGICLLTSAAKTLGGGAYELVEPLLVFIQAGGGVDEGVGVEAGDGRIGDVISHPAAGEVDG